MEHEDLYVWKVLEWCLSRCLVAKRVHLAALEPQPDDERAGKEHPTESEPRVVGLSGLLRADGAVGRDGR